MQELVLTILGVVLGFVLSATWERHKDRSAKRHVQKLLERELRQNVDNLKEVLAIIDAYPANELPKYIEPLSIDEIARRVETACRHDALDACRQDLPSLGSRGMEAVLSFYDLSQRIPGGWRDTERFAGNIRATFFEDPIRELIELAETARQTMNV